MGDFNSELNNWEEKIKAKIRVVEWLRTLQPPDFAVLLRRLVVNAMTTFTHDQERYDRTLHAIQREFEDLNGIDWHLKREVYDRLAKRAQEADITIGFRKFDDYPEGRFYVDWGGMHYGNTLIEAVFHAKKAWEK